MEKLLKTLVFYMFRIDCTHSEENEQNIKQFMSKHDDCKYYVFSREHGKDTEKEHYQGCLFLTKETTGQGYRNIIKKKWVTKHKTGNSVAFTVARKRESITAYSNNKEHKGYITNMPQELLDSLPKWVPYKQFIEQIKKQKRKNDDAKFKEVLTEYIKSNPPDYCLPYHGYQILANIAYSIYEKDIPMRSQVLLSKHIFPKHYFLKLLHRELQYEP